MENSENDVTRPLEGRAKSDEESHRAKPALASGLKIGGYVLVEKLGAGGIGEVWKARDPRLNRVVALKFIAAERPGSTAMRDLLREAQGRRREAGSEGSVEQKCEPINKNRIGGVSVGRAGSGREAHFHQGRKA